MYEILNKTSAKTRLAMIHPGEKALIVGMDAGRTMKARLESIGMIPGTEIHIVQNMGRGPMLVSIGEGRLTVGRGIAEKIVVV